MTAYKSIITLICFVLISLTSFAADYPDPPEIQGLSIGDAAPDFKLPGVDGKTHTLDEYKKSDVLAIIFTCNHCPTSRMYEDTIIEIARKYKDKSFALVAISSNDPGALRPDEVSSSPLGDSFEEMKFRAKEKKYNFPYLYDGKTQKAAMSYGAIVTPQVFLFDKDRKLQYTGAIDHRWKTDGGAEGAIKALLTGKEVTTKSTRPYGCSTKWGFKRYGVDEAAKEWNKQEVKLDEVDLDKIKELAKNDTYFLRMICVWSMDDKSCIENFEKLVMLRRIYKYTPFELMLINCDPVEKKEKVHEFLKKYHASIAPVTTEIRKRRAGNFILSSGSKEELFKALGQEKVKSAPCSMIIYPEGKVIMQQTKKLDIHAIRVKLAGLLSRR